ncbi:MAG: hypothetical protein OXF27_21175 [Acidobacteria bacterium]|nr:hypothetical protein [Acidobacteriota bacterium]
MVAAASFLNLNCCLAGRLLVKGRYHETLTNMNDRQMARRDAAQGAVFHRLLREHRDQFDHFDYELREPGR